MLIIVVLVIGITVAGGLLYTSNSSSGQQIAEQGVYTLVDQGDKTFFVSPQADPNTVLVDQVTMRQPGFVVIREVINEKPGQIVEVSEYLEEGTHMKLEINLETALQFGGVDFSGEFPVTSEFVGVIYVDDGDGGFNPSLDSVAYANGAALAWYVGTGNSAPETAVVASVSGVAGGNIASTVVYTDVGFSPQTAEISQGEAVQFVNESSRPMWVASNVHPAHTILSTFDQFGTSGFGESYKYTFDQQGTWEYHDHVNAGREGVIIVR